MPEEEGNRTMTQGQPEHRLREHYLDPAPGITGPGNCPPDDTALKLVLGELSRSAAREFSDHAGMCPTCAAAWRLARAWADEIPRSRPEGRRRFGVYALAAAAVLALAFVLLPSGPELLSPIMRSPEIAAARSLLEDDAALSVNEAVLRWSAGPDGARYEVRVTDTALRAVAGPVTVSGTEYRVPVESLADLADGERILWQVETVLPDGSRSTSRTFSARIRRP
jgi:hypothetical protein